MRYSESQVCDASFEVVHEGGDRAVVPATVVAPTPAQHLTALQRSCLWSGLRFSYETEVKGYQTMQSHLVRRAV
jgi:hypothetical protein